ncbi:hypothetical protein RAA17_04715 [Komagataeibacter rhaeticus]|nr:hypothetical protein [Komagataeibacter rhaeticus]
MRRGSGEEESAQLRGCCSGAYRPAEDWLCDCWAGWLPWPEFCMEGLNSSCRSACGTDRSDGASLMGGGGVSGVGVLGRGGVLIRRLRVLAVVLGGGLALFLLLARRVLATRHVGRGLALQPAGGGGENTISTCGSDCVA